MISAHGDTPVYTDFQGLTRLRAEAGKQSPEALRETARQFEALFVQMMLKAMRDASPGGGLLESEQTGFYREMYDRQIALHMARGRGIGIADTLMQQLGGNRTTTAAMPKTAGRTPAASRPAAGATDAPGTDWRLDSPADFVDSLWPHAARGAAARGARSAGGTGRTGNRLGKKNDSWSR